VDGGAARLRTAARWPGFRPEEGDDVSEDVDWRRTRGRGAMVTIDPLAQYTLELTIRGPDHAEPSRARFGPTRIPLSGSHGDVRKPPTTDTK
jgi:hypothetical protein